MTSAALLADLRSRTRSQVISGINFVSQKDVRAISTGCPSLDQWLPDHGWREGSLIECLSPAGSGAATFLLRTLVNTPGGSGPLVVVDPDGEFYPPAAYAAGLDLDRLVIVRPRAPADTLWALEQSLRCPGTGAVLGWLDEQTPAIERRLQLAAETGGGLGFLLRSDALRRRPAWADLRLGLTPLPTRGGVGRRWRLELLRARGGLSAPRAAEVEWDDEAGTLSLAAGMVAAARLACAAGA
jgi:protein ImuA